MIYNSHKIFSFNELSESEFLLSQCKLLKDQIESQNKDYILNIDEVEFKNYLISKYSIDPLVIDYESEVVHQPVTSTRMVRGRRETDEYQREIYKCSVSYNFTGSSVIFYIRPDKRILTGAKIHIGSNETVTIFFELNNMDAELFNREKSQKLREAFTNLDAANGIVGKTKKALDETFNLTFHQLKNKYLSENKFYEAINVNVNSKMSAIHSVPLIGKKKIIIEPRLPSDRKYTIEPTITKAIYDQILGVILNSGRSMERKPSTYKGKDEEGIRDLFLFSLEQVFDSYTSTGETFNKGGKVDIILKNPPDGTNLFVAECKIWGGPVVFHDAISQLFDKYLTWRDSKTALMFFVKNVDMSAVVRTIRDEAKKHPYFVKEIKLHDESASSYLFHLPSDKDKMVHLEIMAFHFI